MKKILNTFLLFALITGALIAIGFSTGNTDRAVQPDKVKINNPIKKVAEEINLIKQNKTFDEVNLFTYNKNSQSVKNVKDIVKKSSTLLIKKNELNTLLKNPKENIVFRIPLSSNEYLEMELTRKNIFSSDARFNTLSNSGKTPIAYTPGIFYKGIIKGDDKSVASVSIFENMVVAVASDKSGNYVLGMTGNKTGFNQDYILYNDRDLLVKNKFECKVDDYNSKFLKASKEAMNDIEKIKESPYTATVPVKMYFEADYDMHQRYNLYPGHTYDVISAIFSSVQTLYQNEQIAIVISEVGVWTSIDPYASSNDSYEILLDFGGRSKDTFYGNLGHLLSTGHNQILGGIAWINVLCVPFNSQDSSGRYAFSNIDTNYQGLPLYSWTVGVITHEIGHNIGSKHTHACAWPTSPGVIGAIDSCYNAEGNCFYYTQPNYNGTIMSYCHLNGAVNFSLGFGPLPGDTIRFCYNNAPCLKRYINSSELPVTFDLMQNFPNPFNPVTKLQYAIPKESYVSIKIYDVTGKEITTLVNNQYYAVGVYDVSFNAANYSLASGVYFYKLIANDAIDVNKVVFTQVKKMVLTK